LQKPNFGRDYALTDWQAFTFEITPSWRSVPGARNRQLHFDKLSAGIVDFCAPRKKLIIELDGSQHLEQEEYDKERSAFLESKGYRILRFWNNEVINNLEAVILAISHALEDGKQNP